MQTDKSKVIIHKAKLKKGVTLVVEYTENGSDGPSTVQKTCTADVHPDLLKKFSNLSTHLAALCDQYDRAGVLSDRIEFRGFTIKGEAEKEGVILTGLRTVNDSRKLLLNSPFQRFGEEGEDVGYEKVQDLLDDLHAAKQEVLAYLFESKHAPNPQGNLFPDKGPDDIDEQEDADEA